MKLEEQDIEIISYEALLASIIELQHAVIARTFI